MSTNNFDNPSFDSSDVVDQHAGHSNGKTYGSGIPGTGGGPVGDVSVMTDNMDGTFTHTAGGISTTFAANQAPPSTADQQALMAPIDVGAGDTLPPDWMNAKNLHINVDNMTSDFDVTGYSPANIQDGAVLILRKIDASPFAITYTDCDGVPYRFADIQFEVVSLMWIAAKNCFHVI